MSLSTPLFHKAFSCKYLYNMWLQYHTKAQSLKAFIYPSTHPLTHPSIYLKKWVVDVSFKQFFPQFFEYSLIFLEFLPECVMVKEIMHEEDTSFLLSKYLKVFNKALCFRWCSLHFLIPHNQSATYITEFLWIT